MPINRDPKRNKNILKRTLIIFIPTIIFIIIIMSLLNNFIFRFSATDFIIGNVFGMSIIFFLIMFVVIIQETKKEIKNDRKRI